MIHLIMARVTPDELHDMLQVLVISSSLRWMSKLNIRPRLGNRSMYLQNPLLRDKIERIVDDLLKGVVP